MSDPKSRSGSPAQPGNQSSSAPLNPAARVLAMRNLPTTRAPKRKREDTREDIIESPESADEKDRLLNIECRFHMLRYHSWINFGDAYDKIYRDRTHDSTGTSISDSDFDPEKDQNDLHSPLWHQTRTSFMNSTRDWKHYTLKKFEELLTDWSKEDPLLLTLETEPCRVELECRFNEATFFSVFYYLRGYLDFDTTMKKHRKGGWFLKKVWCALGCEVQKYLKAGGSSDLNARNLLRKQFDLIPLVPLFDTVKLEHFARLQCSTKKQKGRREQRDLTIIDSLAFGEDGPPTDDEASLT
ncbi:hypothetical protein K3495_g11974 [Podosphaera aphanis]|nr:hypothetical protein K3495_g11974 [Podosphaera aphanis]